MSINVNNLKGSPREYVLVLNIVSK